MCKWYLAFSNRKGTDAYRSLNVGMALDEGLANPSDMYTVFVGERGPWWLKV